MSTKIARRRLGMVFAVCGFAMVELPCSGQENSITLCGVELRIGMPKDDVISKLGKNCKVQHSGQNWFVSGGHDLFFDGDALSGVRKDFRADGGESADLLADFLTAMNEAVGGTVSTVDENGSSRPKYASRPAVVIVKTLLAPTDGQGGPGFVTQELTIRLGQKEFVLEVTRRVGAGKPAIAIAPIVCTEALGK